MFAARHEALRHGFRGNELKYGGVLVSLTFRVSVSSLAPLACLPLVSGLVLSRHPSVLFPPHSVFPLLASCPRTFTIVGATRNRASFVAMPDDRCEAVAPVSANEPSECPADLGYAAE